MMTKRELIDAMKDVPDDALVWVEEHISGYDSSHRAVREARTDKWVVMCTGRTSVIEPSTRRAEGRMERLRESFPNAMIEMRKIVVLE